MNIGIVLCLLLLKLCQGGYGPALLNYTDVVSFNGKKLITTVGGTGLAVSAYSKYKKLLLSLLQWLYQENTNGRNIFRMEVSPGIFQHGRMRK